MTPNSLKLKKAQLQKELFNQNCLQNKTYNVHIKTQLTHLMSKIILCTHIHFKSQRKPDVCLHLLKQLQWLLKIFSHI